MQDAIDGLEIFAVGAIVGAGLMYLMDPSMGRTRRNYLRDKLIKGINIGRRETKRFLRDKRNRAKGLLYEMKGRGSSLHSRTAGVGSVGQAASDWP